MTVQCHRKSRDRSRPSAAAQRSSLALNVFESRPQANINGRIINKSNSVSSQARSSELDYLRTPGLGGRHLSNASSSSAGSDRRRHEAALCVSIRRRLMRTQRNCCSRMHHSRRRPQSNETIALSCS